MERESVHIRTAEPSDGDTLAGIYNQYVAETVVTFEENPVSGAEMGKRIDAVCSASLPWLVAEKNASVVGYAYASPWKTRSAYRFSVETTVYIASGHAGCGIGTMLYSELLARIEKAGVHAVIGGVALPNEASVALMQKFGFEKVAHFRQVGFKLNRWVDVGYWERVLRASGRTPPAPANATA